MSQIKPFVLVTTSVPHGYEVLGLSTQLHAISALVLVLP